MKEEQRQCGGRVPDFSDASEDLLGAYEDDMITWELEGIGRDHQLDDDDDDDDTKALITCGLPLQVVNGHPNMGTEDLKYYYYYSDLLFKTEEQEQEQEQDDDDDGIRTRRPQSYCNLLWSSSSGLNLTLNYQKVLDAWSDRGSLWAGADTNNKSLSDTSAAAGGGGYHVGGHMGGMSVLRRREASVLRYKEKRHSRLFAKKIRYQVRKVNADQRPRFKGRFVKRSLEKIFI